MAPIRWNGPHTLICKVGIKALSYSGNDRETWMRIFVRNPVICLDCWFFVDKSA